MSFITNYDALSQELNLAYELAIQRFPDRTDEIDDVFDAADEVHIRHQLRVATKFRNEELSMPANVCLDVAVIQVTDLNDFKSDDFVANDKLITFGEAKHMTAFAELVASFVGLITLKSRTVECVTSIEVACLCIGHWQGVLFKH